MSHKAGHIIIQKLAETESMQTEDKATLKNIADRSHERCSFLDAVRVVLIVWKYLQQ